MPCYKVKVKWGRENFPNIEVNTDEEPLLFKAQLYALTGVQPDRQKVILKGITLKDEEWNVSIKEGAVILMLGTKDEVPLEPTQEERPKFIEDMNESELATAMELPPGLKNLGNTCYMNAVIQCLRSVPELRNSLKQYGEDLTERSVELAHSKIITSSLHSLFNNMSGAGTVTPILLLQTLHIASPQFAETSAEGGYRQQDANECWSELMKMLQQQLPALKNSSSNSPSQKSFIEQFFGGTFNVEMKCSEASDEPPSFSTENFLQLSCFISQEVKYMHSGLRSKMQEQLTKMSDSLSRDAIYTRTSLINRLPAYLTINFVRFQYKEKEKINAKVLKDIKFPIDFDAFDLCTTALQNKLTPMRAKFKEVEDAHLEKETNLKNNPKSDEKKPKTKALPYFFEDDLGSNNSGYYTLQAVLTHQGRSSSSGHYVAWIRQKDDKWMKFDDDIVTPVTSEDILRLSGGGDWHCAYVLLYGPRILEVEDEKMEE